MSLCTVDKSEVKISQHFVAFSEYMNFIIKKYYLMHVLFYSIGNGSPKSVHSHCRTGRQCNLYKRICCQPPSNSFSPLEWKPNQNHGDWPFQPWSWHPSLQGWKIWSKLFWTGHPSGLEKLSAGGWSKIIAHNLHCWSVLHWEWTDFGILFPFFLKPSRNKSQKNFQMHQNWCFFTALGWEKDTIFGAARKFFGCSYFATT